jgi:chemotaxis protein CheD
MFIEIDSRSAPQPPQRQRITVMQGMVEVSGKPDVVLTTVLGSCVAACLYDPIARIGGMNHFLLAEPPAHANAACADEHFGVYLMELLINEMMKRGAARPRMRAHLYGGANINANMQQIGTMNARFAERFLAEEGIMVSHRDLGGTSARRVDFLAAEGKARCRHVDATVAPATAPIRSPSRPVGDVELF